MIQRADQSIPMISLKNCDFEPTQKILKLSSEFFGMPAKFAVRSNHTNAVVEFVRINENDPLFDQDGWDGEQMIYRPTTFVPHVSYLVIYNQH